MADLEGQTQKVANEIFHKPNFPVTLKFLDVVYTIKVQQGGFVKTKKSEERQILKGITGIVMPGEVLAMLGPSGSGKTTLLSALGGRLGGDLSGSIIYNEKPLSKAMNRNIGFVTQDDVLHPHLTVMETLVYTALLRLPRTMSKQQKSQHAEAVMDQLGLSKCKNSIIGGGLLRGVSGGERKRVSIGQEMLINPSLLFLDEPTSGLDSTTALKIVSTVRELADGGRTVVMTVHQPSSRLYYLFHKILLLSDGNPYYFGDGSTAMQYFSTLGFAPSVAMNPADFLLDLTNGISTADKNEDEGAIKRALVLAYQTHLSDNLRSKLVGGDDNKPQHSSPADDNWSNSWWAQFSVLLQRGIKERKHESFSILRIAEVLIVAFMAGLLWWQSDSSHIQDQVGLFFFYTVFWGFYPLFQSVFTFPQECLTLSKERSSSMYRLSPYLMALTIGDLPMELILPSVFYTITYWMAGFKATAGSFFSGLFILLYSVLCTQGLGLAIGAVVMDQKAAIALGSVIMLSSLLASGFYVQNVPSFISWIKYLSIAQHTFKLLLVSQYSRDETYVCDTTNNVSCLVEDFPAVKNVGLHGYVVSLFAMGGMLLAYRLVAYIALTKIGVTRR